MDNLPPCMHLAGLVLVMDLLHLYIYPSAKGRSNSLHLLHSKMWLKCAALITNKTTLHPALFGWAHSR